MSRKALCDAAVSDLPFPSASTAVGEMYDNSDGGDLGSFNFTSLSQASDAADDATTSYEKYLYKALNLLKGDVARTRFALASGPDLISYNSVLHAAAKCCAKNSTGGQENRVVAAIMSSCLRSMEERKISADVVTYNAMIQAALAAASTKEEGLRLIDQVLSDPDLEPDRYTIGSLLKPFLAAGRRDEIWSILHKFYYKNVGSASGNSRVASAFEAFLTKIVQDTGEVEFAHEVLQRFFLPGVRKKKRMQLTQMISVIERENQEKEGEELVQAVLPSINFRESVEPSSRPPARTRHFNILFGGYNAKYEKSRTSLGRIEEEGSLRDHHTNANMETANSTLPDAQKSYELLDTMLDLGVPPDAYTVTHLMALPSNPEKITSLLKRIKPAMKAGHNPATYRSIISAYGKAGDPSSSIWVFEEMIHSCRNEKKLAESWNVILGALASACAEENAGGNCSLDILNSRAANAQNHLRRQSDEPEHKLLCHLNGKSYVDASLAILDIMRNETIAFGPETYSIRKPNSQSYCLVASALSGYGTSAPNSDRALTLFRNAMKEGVAADGRFLNAVLRCFGNDIKGALAAWKSDIGPAAASYEQRRSTNARTKAGINLIAAYDGLMHVCGRAFRPDVATRITYAMNKAGVEPTEGSLNSYLAGKRVALRRKEEAKFFGLRNQYEALLSVECTKFNPRDKRQDKDLKIRIILK